MVVVVVVVVVVEVGLEKTIRNFTLTPMLLPLAFGIFPFFLRDADCLREPPWLGSSLSFPLLSRECQDRRRVNSDTCCRSFQIFSNQSIVSKRVPDFQRIDVKIFPSRITNEHFHSARYNAMEFIRVVSNFAERCARGKCTEAHRLQELLYGLLW